LATAQLEDIIIHIAILVKDKFKKMFRHQTVAFCDRLITRMVERGANK